MMLNEHALLGFHKELEKSAVSKETGLKGLALGAALGAGLTYMSADKLDEVVSENKMMAVIAGALIGAGLLGGAGYLLGKDKVQPRVVDPRTGRPVPVMSMKPGMDSNRPPAWY